MGKSVGDLTWQNPGRARAGQVDHQGVAEALVAKPGEWLRVSSYRTRSSAGSMAYSIRIAKLNVYAPAGSFEAVSRADGGEFWVFARYVGQDGEHARP